MRSCAVARAFIFGGGVADIASPDADAWHTHLRVMHDQSTRRIFDLLCVNSHADALVLRDTVWEVARRTWSPNIASKYGSVSLLDLTCQACEFNGILGAVKSIHGGGDDQAIRWLMAHLPGDVGALKYMRQQLKIDRAKRVRKKGDGLDNQAASIVAATWLSRKPDKPAVSLQGVFTSGGWDIFGLPRVYCPECSQIMLCPTKGRKRRECDACYRKRIREADAARQAKRRRQE